MKKVGIALVILGIFGFIGLLIYQIYTDWGVVSAICAISFWSFILGIGIAIIAEIYEDQTSKEDMEGK